MWTYNAILTEQIGLIGTENSYPGKLLIGNVSNYFQILSISKPIITNADDSVDMSDYYNKTDCNKLYVKTNGDSTINGNLTLNGKFNYNPSNTITHYAPIEGDINDFVIGLPVFMSGKVYKRINETWIPSTNEDRQDCICSVMIEGNEKNYVGVIVSIDEKNNSITFGSHGDFMFNVDDSSTYEIGDVVLYDGRILDENVTLTLKLQRSIVGTITSIIDEHAVAIFRS